MPAAAAPMVIADTGPIVALLDAGDAHHDWARAQFAALRPPLLTCEAVLSEASFLVQRAGADPGLPAALVAQGVLRVEPAVRTDGDAVAIARSIRQYRSVPMSFADACLVRLVEQQDRGSILTLDSGFRIYRRDGRRVIPLLIPA